MNVELNRTYVLPDGVKGKLTFDSAIGGRLVLTRDTFAHYDLTITDRERLTQLHKEVEQLELRTSDVEVYKIVRAALSALLHNNLELNLNTFAVTVQAFFTEDTTVIISAIHEMFTRLGFLGVPLTAMDIFGANEDGA